MSGNGEGIPAGIWLTKQKTSQMEQSEKGEVVTEELLGKIQTQIEFYFGDANLRRDRYLRTRIEGNEQGFVKITDLLTFNRLKALTKDPQAVANAVKKSSVLVISDNGEEIRRKVPLPRAEQPVEVSAFVSGLPFNATIDEVIEAFKTIPNVEPLFVSLRKESNAFNGEAFVEFANASQVQICAEKAPTELKFRKTETLSQLKVIPLVEWMKQHKTNMPPAKKDQQEGGGASAAAATTTSMKEKPTEVEKGSLILVDGVDPECTREIIRECIDSKITFIDYERGQTSAIIRFATTADATKAQDILNSKPEDFKFKFTGFRVMDDTETEAYAKKVDERKKARFQRAESNSGKQPSRGGNHQRGNNRGGGRGGDRGSRGGDNKNKRNRDGNDRESKKQKSES